jgi:bisphosphoglycerate-independent phosphoglycerate mutase (AlkP superfamily)
MNALKKERSPQEIMTEQKNIKGILQDVAATVLDLLGIPPPSDMDGKSLLPILYDQ